MASSLVPKWLQMAPRNPQEPPGTPQEAPGTPRNPQEGGGVCYLDSPSLNVALWEVGFTFFVIFIWFFETPISETPATGALTRPEIDPTGQSGKTTNRAIPLVS